MTVEWDLPTLREGMEETDEWRALTAWARSVPEAGEMDPYLALDFWAEWLVMERVRKKYDAVVVLTGDEGTGKSTLALRFIQKCSALSHVPFRIQDTCYSAKDLVTAYRTAVPAKCVFYDEGVRGTFAGEQMTPEQRAVVKALALVRESGAILFALYPSIWMAAKQIRARRACLWIHIVHRGLGRVHERDRRLNYLPTDALGLAISPRAPHVAWTAFRPDSKVWTDYLAIKKAKLDEFLRETEADLKMREGKPADRTERARAANRERVRRWRERQKN